MKLSPATTIHQYPHGLTGVLLQDLAVTESGQHRHLSALIELGNLRDNLRESLVDRKLSGLLAYSLFGTHPELAEAVPYGPMLFTHEDGPQALLDKLGSYNGNIISAWIVSVLPAGGLANYLSNCIVTRNPSRADSPPKRHLIRYYAPEVFPTLYKLADPVWLERLLEPVVSWSHPIPGLSGEQWRYYRGAATQPAAQSFYTRNPLPMTGELWQALENDPLPYKITNVLQAQAPGLFGSDCYGVRVAHVEMLLEEAREQGLQEEPDFLTYTWCVLAQPVIRQEKRWRDAVCRSAKGEAALSQIYLAQTA
jgi:hypothetical protein